MGSGTYQVDGTNVTLTSTGSNKPELDSFCVSGDTATFSQTTAGGISSTLVLRKK
jgi:hypothetical protein